MNKPDLPSYPSVTPNAPLEPFKFWVQMALPTVYDDSLSYYELLSKVVAYLNTTNEHLTNVDNNFATINASLSELWDEIQTWFDDLDVTEEINAKVQSILDIWASPYNPDVPQSGTLHAMFLPDIVAEAQNTADNWLTDNIHTETGYVLDDSLSLDNAAAPASMVGNSIGNMGNVYYKNVTNHHVATSGAGATSSNSSLMYGFIPLNKAYSKIIVYINFPERFDINYSVRYVIKSAADNYSDSVLYVTRIPSGTATLTTTTPIVIDYSDYIANNENLYLRMSISDGVTTHVWSPVTDRDSLTFRYDNSLIDQIFADKLRSPALLSNTYNIAEYFGLTKYRGWAQMISAIGASSTFVDMADNSIVVGTTENVTGFVNTEHHTFPFTLSVDHKHALIKIKGGTVGRAVYFYLIMDDDAGQPIYIGRQIHDNTYNEEYIGAWSLFSASPVENVSTTNRPVESKYVGDIIKERTQKMYRYVYNVFPVSDETWLQDTGIPFSTQPLATTRSTKHIKVNPDEDVYFTGCPSPIINGTIGYCLGCLYDIDKKFIGYIDASSEEFSVYNYTKPDPEYSGAYSIVTMYKWHIPEGVEYIRLNIQTEASGNRYMCTLSNCECYIGEQLANIITYDNTPNKNVKIAFVGASNIMIDRRLADVTSNPYCSLYGAQHYVTGFQEYFRPYCNRVDSYGYSGHPFYSLPETDTDYSRYPKGVAQKFVELITANPTYISDIDILYISGDRNYLTYGRRTLIGEYTDGLTSDNYGTYCGALNTLIRHVYALNSNIQIFVGNNGYDYEKYYDADNPTTAAYHKETIDLSNTKINDCLNYWRLPLIDSMHTSQLNGYTMANITNNPNITTPLLTYDNTHPNAWGAKIIGESMRRIIFGC